MARYGRFGRLRRLEGLDPVKDFHEIYRATVTLEFPWDMKQALSFALFRTYAVPGIGDLLARTGEFTRRTQKRYDDTALILDAVIEHGFGTAQARDSFRRMNQMHGAYPISNDDMRYVLSTFVVTPVRWLAAYGWRPMSPVEKAASVTYYRAVASHMNIREVPGTYAGFERLMDGYEREHFAFSPGGQAVADATLSLLGTFPPFHLLPARLVRPVAYALMDDPLLTAFRYPRPNPMLRAAVRAALAARGRAGRWQPPRNDPRFARQNPDIRSYPDGYDVSSLGTFPDTSEADPARG
jgi:hypothetical protein